MARYETASQATKGARKYQEDACAFARIGVPASVTVPAALGGSPGTRDRDGIARATPDNAPEYITGNAVIATGEGGAELVAVLADGMGGHAGGALASQTACQSFITGYAHIYAGPDPGDRLALALEMANRGVADEVTANPSLNGMGCTLIGAIFDAHGLRWVSVGDSHLFLFRRGELFMLNENHSLAPVLDELVATGQMTPEDALHHPRRHYLRSAVTGDEIELVDLPAETTALLPGDCVVLASDGIDTLEPDEIAELIETNLAAGAVAVTGSLIGAIAHAAVAHQDNTTIMAVVVLADEPLAKTERLVGG